MKKFYTIFIFIVGIGIGLIIPYNLCSSCETKGIISVCNHVFWDWALRVLQVVGTLAAVFVALFKEWFYKMLIHPSIEITSGSNEIKELLDDTNQDEVAEYFSQLKVSNKGKAYAANCQIYLSEIKHISHNNTEHDIVNIDTSIPWDDNTPKTDIPENFAQSFKWLKILPERKITEEQTIPQTLFIGSQQISQDYMNGQFFVTFKVVCPGIQPSIIKMQLTYDGKWENRQSKMKEVIQYKIIKDLKYW